MVAGNQVALFLGNPLAAGLCDSSLGWPAVYYVSGQLQLQSLVIMQFPLSCMKRSLHSSD